MMIKVFYEGLKVFQNLPKFHISTNFPSIKYKFNKIN